MSDDRPGLRDSLSVLLDSTPEQRAALRADLAYEVAHTGARIGVLNAMAAAIDKKLAEHGGSTSP